MLSTPGRNKEGQWPNYLVMKAVISSINHPVG
jgi:hypothetical protein